MSVGCEHAIFENGIYMCSINEEPCAYKVPNSVKCKYSDINELTCNSCIHYLKYRNGCFKTGRTCATMKTCSEFEEREGSTCKYCYWFDREQNNCTNTSMMIDETFYKTIGNPEIFTCEYFRYINRYNKHIMEAISGMLEDEDISCLSIEDIENMYSKSEILDAVLSYDGLHGYVDTLVNIIEQIFDIRLNSYENF